LRYVYYNKKISLNEIIEKLTPYEMLSFVPFRTYIYWTQNITLLLTIDEFLPTLYLLGYKIDKIFPEMNVSNKYRGTLSQKSINKIKQVFKDDMKIYEYWCRK
jgi:hypothetical protein